MQIKPNGHGVKSGWKIKFDRNTVMVGFCVYERPRSRIMVRILQISEREKRQSKAETVIYTMNYVILHFIRRIENVPTGTYI